MCTFLTHVLAKNDSPIQKNQEQDYIVLNPKYRARDDESGHWVETILVP